MKNKLHGKRIYLQILFAFLFALILSPSANVSAETITPYAENDMVGLPVITPDDTWFQEFNVHMTLEQYESLLPTLSSIHHNWVDYEIGNWPIKGPFLPGYDSDTISSTSMVGLSKKELTTYYVSSDSSEPVVRSKLFSNTYEYYQFMSRSINHDENGDVVKTLYAFVYDVNFVSSDKNSRYYKLYYCDTSGNVQPVLGKSSGARYTYVHDSGSSSVTNTSLNKTSISSSPTYKEVYFNFNLNYELEVNKGTNSTKETELQGMFCSIPVFDNMADAEEYFKTEDTSKALNPHGFFTDNIPDKPDDPSKEEPNDIGNFRLYGVKINKIFSKLGLTSVSWNGVTNDGWSHLVDNDSTIVIPTFYTYDNKGSDRVWGMDELDIFKNFSMNLRFNKGNPLNDATGFSFNWSDLYDEFNKKGYFWDGDIWLTPLYVYTPSSTGNPVTVTGKPTIIDSYTGDITQVVVDKDGNEVIKPVNPDSGLVEDEENDLPDDSISSNNPSFGGSEDGSSGSSTNIFDFLMKFIEDLPNYIKYLSGIFSSLLNWLGSLPGFLRSVFIFLPYEIQSIIYGTILVVCFLGLLKAVIR